MCLSDNRHPKLSSIMAVDLDHGMWNTQYCGDANYYLSMITLLDNILNIYRIAPERPTAFGYRSPNGALMERRWRAEIDHTRFNLST